MEVHVRVNYFATNWTDSISSYDRKRASTSGSADSAVFEFYCSQREGKQYTRYVPVEEASKRRQRKNMDRFKCEGALVITISDVNPRYVRIRMTHLTCHDDYCCKGNIDRGSAWYPEGTRRRSLRCDGDPKVSISNTK